jgi:hypothetical protein
LTVWDKKCLDFGLPQLRHLCNLIQYDYTSR